MGPCRLSLVDLDGFIVIIRTVSLPSHEAGGRKFPRDPDGFRESLWMLLFDMDQEDLSVDFVFVVEIRTLVSG